MQSRSTKTSFKRSGESPCRTFSCQSSNISIVCCERVIFINQILERWDVPLYVTLNALSCMRFILLLRFRLWNIQTKGQYLNWHSLKVFILLLLLLHPFVQKGCKTRERINFFACFSKKIIVMVIKSQIPIYCYS